MAKGARQMRWYQREASMKLTRRDFSGLAATGILAAAAPRLFAPALAQDKPLRIGIIAPRSGAAGTAGECGIRAVQWAAERMNKDGGIAGRKIELVFEEETNPKDTIERFRRLILQEKVEAVHGLISTGVSLGVAPVAEEEQALLVMWDGTTQDGVKETMANPRYVFRSTDNECEAVMGPLLATKSFKGKFNRGELSSAAQHSPSINPRRRRCRRLSSRITWTATRKPRTGRRTAPILRSP